MRDNIAPMPGSMQYTARTERLIFLPLFGALLGMWLILITFTWFERATILERTRTQLGATIATLADFNALVQRGAHPASSRASESRTAAI